MTQVATLATASQGWKASNTPRAVATPLPPLNFRNRGYRWPRKTATPASPITPAGSPHSRAAAVASQTANQPLAASPANVSAAAALLPVRNTLVAPGFFDP